jgi:hypothetical protein
MSGGDHKAICDRSGFEGLASQMVKTWDGKYVLRRFWEPRQPQDAVRGVVDDQRVAWTRPEPPDTFHEPGSVRPEDL